MPTKKQLEEQNKKLFSVAQEMEKNYQQIIKNYFKTIKN